MSNAKRELRFVHFSDTHLSSDPGFTLNGVNTLKTARLVLRKILALPDKPDFIIHTGDILDRPSPDGYKQAQRIFAKLPAPIFYLPGNHDDPQMVRENFGKRMAVKWCDASSMSYRADFQGVRLLALDACGEPEIDPHGQLSEASLKFAAESLKTCKGTCLVFLHFATLSMNSKWMDEHMTILNGSKLHKLFAANHKKVLGVFYGHIHQSLQIAQDGVGYFAVPSTCYQLHANRHDNLPHKDRDLRPGFNLVTLIGSKLLVRYHSI